MYYIHYVTIHAFHNIQYMYHFTHDYKHRLHTRMQAIAQTYNIPTHTRMGIILSCIDIRMWVISSHIHGTVSTIHIGIQVSLTVAWHVHIIFKEG